MFTLRSCLNAISVPTQSFRGAKVITDRYPDFPKDFLWGVATSAFQCEGHPAESSGRLSDWSRWTVNNGKIADRTNADVACEFYKRYAEDLKLCEELKTNCFRLSLNWAALRPAHSEPFSLDGETLAYYRALLENIKARGMKTFVTLFHFCLPSWLAEVGGWNNQLAISEFEQFAERVASELGHLTDYWLTLNEPLVYVYRGYVDGEWPPGYKRNYLLGFKTIRQLLEGHAAAYHAIHRVIPEAKVSHVIHWRPFFPRRKFNPLDHLVRHFRDQIFNHLFPRAIQTGELRFPYPISNEAAIKAISGPVGRLAGTADFLAFNYYTREICEFKQSWPPDLFGVQSDVRLLPQTGIGWEIYPEGLYYLLSEDIAPYRHAPDGEALDIFITENGMADKFAAQLSEGDWSLEDDNRVEYLVSHLVAIRRAMSEGANVKGYLHWSLTDNFEWSDGLAPRFGLVRVAYPTQERTLRKSARVFARIAEKNSL